MSETIFYLILLFGIPLCVIIWHNIKMRKLNRELKEGVDAYNNTIRKINKGFEL